MNFDLNRIAYQIMNLPAHITRFAFSLLLLAAAGSVNAASNTSALLGASESGVIELSESSLGVTARSALPSTMPAIGASPAKVVAQRLPNNANGGFDWSTLISLGFGMAGLLWVRRRTTDL